MSFFCLSTWCDVREVGLASMTKPTLNSWIYDCPIADWIAFILAFPITADKYYSVLFVQTLHRRPQVRAAFFSHASLRNSPVNKVLEHFSWRLEWKSWTSYVVWEISVITRHFPKMRLYHFQSVVGWAEIQDLTIVPRRIRMSSKLFFKTVFLLRKRIFEKGKCNCYPRKRAWDELFWKVWNKWLLNNFCERI